MARATAIGLMSGTSYDGVDVALVETDGEGIGRLGPTGYRPYSDRERDVVRRAIAAATNLTERTARPAVLVEAEELVTDMHAEAVEAFLAANGMPPSAVAVVGFHGQTVLHRPDRGLTIQLGNGAALAGRLGIPVVYDFRAADVAAGGRGDAHGHHGRGGRPRDHRAAASAGGMDRRRRRHAQSNLDAHVGAAPRSRAGRDRRRRRLVGRRARGAGLRLSRRANAQGLAAHLSHHDRRTAAAHRRHPRAAVASARGGRGGPRFVPKSPACAGTTGAWDPRQSAYCVLSAEIADHALDAFDHARQALGIDLVRRVARPMV